MKKRKMKKGLRRFLLIMLILALLCGITVLVINVVMIRTTSAKILTIDEAASLDADCILVLGAGVRDDGTPSQMLRHRIDTGIMLYEASAAPKLLMSGDHGRVDYDEVNVMRSRALDAGVPSADVFMDHAGFSTYDSLYRARDIFEVKRVIIVTQKYHLPRALYIAESLGLEAWGVPADLDSYYGQFIRNLREAAARAKDMLYCWVKPEPVVLGEVIPISGSGEATLG
ncbi:MAG: YdcF family protein [Clostridia bacterium]|nr:YdcF family protein [Clostridia bacterium]